MNRKKNRSVKSKFVTFYQDLSANIKKYTIFMKIYNVPSRFFLFASSCDQLSLHSDNHPGIFLLNNEIDMSNWLHKL